MKECPEGKILNPKTNRCVKKDGKIGKSLLKEEKKPDIIIFYSKSADKPAGKNKGEFINNEEEYKELNKIKNFRRYLSNFDECEFKYKGYTYNTIEHAFQGAKITLADKEKGYKFTKDSGDKIGLGDGLMARKNRKLVKLNEKEIKEWNKIKEKVMYEIALEKFKTCKKQLDILQKTGKCELWHTIPRMKPMRCYYLEKIRNNFSF